MTKTSLPAPAVSIAYGCNGNRKWATFVRESRSLIRSFVRWQHIRTFTISILLFLFLLSRYEDFESLAYHDTKSWLEQPNSILFRSCQNSEDVLTLWKKVIDTAPEPRRNGKVWVSQQALLFKYLESLWKIREELPAFVGRGTLSVIDGDIRRVEARAFSFLKEGGGAYVREGYKPLFNRLKRNWQGKEQTRGIVLVGGNPHYRFMLHFLANLRMTLNSTLPVEVYYRGSKDLTQKQLEGLRSFSDVTTKDILEVTKEMFDEDEVSLKDASYALKPFAQLVSEFEEPILCDADTVFFQDPRVVYDDAGYAQTGTVFYLDRKEKNEGTRRWLKKQFRLSGLQPSKQLEESEWWNSKEDRTHRQESGVVVVDKGREDTLFALMFTAWMNSREQRGKLKNKIAFGDKETFWLSFELLHQPYSFVPGYGGAAGTLDRSTNSMLADNILHFDRNTKPLWLNGGLSLSKHMQPGSVPWLSVDTVGLGDGKWVFGRPCWTYKDATWLDGAELGRLVEKMVKVAREVDAKYKPTKFVFG